MVIALHTTHYTAIAIELADGLLCLAGHQGSQVITYYVTITLTNGWVPLETGVPNSRGQTRDKFTHFNFK